VYAQWVSALVSGESERAQRNVEGTEVEVGTGGGGNVAQLIDTCDECTEEAEIDEGDEEGRAFGIGMTEEGVEGPDRS